MGASRWLQVGCHHRRLGHTSVITTGVYAKMVDKIAENPTRYLEELMGLS
jgi:hypothetical protein